MKKNEEFKVNFDVYNLTRLHQPELYRGAKKMQRLNDLRRTNYMDENLYITNTKLLRSKLNLSHYSMKSLIFLL